MASCSASFSSQGTWTHPLSVQGPDRSSLDKGTPVAKHSAALGCNLRWKLRFHAKSTKLCRISTPAMFFKLSHCHGASVFICVINKCSSHSGGALLPQPAAASAGAQQSHTCLGAHGSCTHSGTLTHSSAI